MESNNTKPFFPPQVMLDNFQRLVAPIPGASNLEVLAFLLYPTFVKMVYESSGLTNDWAARQTLSAAKTLIDLLNEEKKENETTLKIAE